LHANLNNLFLPDNLADTKNSTKGSLTASRHHAGGAHLLDGWLHQLGSISFNFLNAKTKYNAEREGENKLKNRVGTGRIFAADGQPITLHQAKRLIQIKFFFYLS